MPRLAALALIIRANPCTDPPKCSASAIAASFPDGSSNPYSRSRARTRSPATRPIVVSPIDAALRLTSTLSSRCPCSIVSTAVMILVVLAIASGRSAPLSSNHCPVSASSRAAARARIGGGG